MRKQKFCWKFLWPIDLFRYHRRKVTYDHEASKSRKPLLDREANRRSSSATLGRKTSESSSKARALCFGVRVETGCCVVFGACKPGPIFQVLTWASE